MLAWLGAHKEPLPAAASELCGVPKSVRSESIRLSLLRVISLNTNDGLIAEHLRKQSFGWFLRRAAVVNQCREADQSREAIKHEVTSLSTSSSAFSSMRKRGEREEVD